jgi:PHD/YefM family antitoxin component YafN of YafNO toxin-antitoxin module
MNMTQTMQPRPIATLPDWAFRALAAHALDTLIDRTEHETLLVMRRGQPDLVLISHEAWKRLSRAAEDQRTANMGEGMQR